MHPLNVYWFLGLTTSALAAPVAEQKHNTRCKSQYCLASHQHYPDEIGSFCRAIQRVSTSHECSASASSCSVCSNLYNRLHHACSDISKQAPYIMVPNMLSSSRIRQVIEKFDR